MFFNYLKITLRNLARNKTYSFINIFGLAAGLATCLLILLYIKDERSYDKHHQYGDRVYRIVTQSSLDGGGWAAAPGPLSWAVKNNLPEVEEATRLLTFPEIQNLTLKVKYPSETRQFLENNGYYVDSTFFQLFTYHFIYGNAASALNRPNSLVISWQIASKFFGNENPVGRTMIVVTPFGEMNYTVRGVFDNSRSKSHIPANYFLSMNNSDMGTWAANQTSWASNNIFYTYVKIKPGTDPIAFGKKLDAFFQRVAGADMKSAGIAKTLRVQPLKDIYLHSDIGNEFPVKGNITYLYILGSIAAFILVIACINFMNLSTARSERRAKEVGVRKVMGVGKHGLIQQFLGESLIMAIIAQVVALLLVSILLPYFNQLTQKNLTPFGEPDLLVWIAALTLLTGLLAGLYPALYLAAFRPVVVLKGKIVNHFSATIIRKTLVIFQFTVSVCLIIAVIVIWKQMNFLNQQHLGFNKDRQLVLPLTLGYNNTPGNFEALKNELLKNPKVKSVTGCSVYPGAVHLSDMLFFAEGKSNKDFVDIYLSAVEDDYLETLGIQLLHGRVFSRTDNADSAGIILNETAIRQLGYDPATAVGRKIYFDFNQYRGNYEIVGIVKDFHFESLHSGIKPYGLITSVFGNPYTFLIANLNTDDYPVLLSELESTWKKIIPNSPLNYSFLDQDFQHNYEKDQLTSNIVVNFTIIAILIASLGLFGLAVYSAEQRTREIGIRKVLGASVTNITTLLSKDFLRLVMIAIVVATPIAWFVMNQWLQSFAYKIGISWWMFATAGALAVFIALATISFQSIKSALANPVKSLRSE